MNDYPPALTDDPERCPICGGRAGSETDCRVLPSAVSVRTLADQEAERKEQDVFILTERTYVNRDSTKIVAVDSPECHALLGIPGDEISDETAERLGLIKGARKPKAEKPAVLSSEAVAPKGKRIRVPGRSRKVDDGTSPGIL